jgi:phosphoglycolate phosphatase
MARNAGTAGVGVVYGAHPPEALATVAPLHLAESIEDLRAWLDENA